MDARINDATWLRNAYEIERRSLADIAKQLGCSAHTVLTRMDRFGIERRSRSWHVKGTPKSATQRQKMSEARRRYWERHPDREEFKKKISRNRRNKHGRKDGRERSYKDKLRNRYVMEKMLGRLLKADEVVHHKDGNPRNDDPVNLLVMDRREHARLHNRLRKRDTLGRFISDSLHQVAAQATAQCGGQDGPRQ